MKTPSQTVRSIATFTLLTVAQTVPLCLPAQNSYSTPYVFSTLAGAASIGSADGVSIAAKFAYPEGLAVDSSGKLYVADTDNCTIRQVVPLGLVSTIAGSAGQTGSTNGLGSAARFTYPNGVTVGPDGTLYVADSNNNQIRTSIAGAVTTLAGSGIAGYADGSGTTTQFHAPNSLAVDAAGNVYVADSGNNAIRKITSGGTVTTLAGLAGTGGSADGSGSAARFNFPTGIAIDSAGYLYVADYGNHTIRKVSPAGDVSTLAGLAGSSGSVDGTGNGARFANPNGVAVDAAGNVYVADYFNSTVRKVSPAGAVTTLAGLAGNNGAADGNGSAARFNYPLGVAVDTSGNVYVLDSDNNAIRQISPTGDVTTVAGTASTGSADGPGFIAHFNFPTSVAVDSSGTVTVADERNNTIRQITSTGTVSTLAGSTRSFGSSDGTGSSALFHHPFGVAADNSGNIYVADYLNSTVRKITSSGVVTTLAGSPGAPGSADGTGSGAQFNLPRGVAVDSSGNVYVADYANSLIRKISASGVVTTLAGSPGSTGTADGTGGAARFNFPTGVAVDKSGNIYVADDHNNAIRKMTSAGVVTTLAGLPGTSGSIDGTGTAARFANPIGIAVDGNGNVYVADYGNRLIRRITPAGVVSTLAGSVSATPGAADSVGSAALFNYPEGIAVDDAGNVYVADTYNNTIRLGQLAPPPQITLQPTSQSTLIGGGVQFTVNASGNPDPTYQWYFNDNAISGATTNSLNVSNVQAANIGNYYVAVVNPFGTTKSNVVTLSLLQSPGPASTSSGGGGGGAVSPLMLAALLLPVFRRRMLWSRK